MEKNISILIVATMLRTNVLLVENALNKLRYLPQPADNVLNRKDQYKSDAFHQMKKASVIMQSMSRVDK